MLETAITLIWAHVVADFIVQTRPMVRAKRRPSIFGLHIAVVALSAVVALGPASMRGWNALAVVVIGHALIDTIKVFGLSPDWIEASPFRPLVVFAIDQIAHGLTIVIASLWAASAFAEGGWPYLLDEVDQSRFLVLLSVSAGFVVATRVGELVLALFMDGFRRLWARPSQDKDDASDELPRAGAWIGRLERALVYLFVLLGQFNAIGFVITAKSILRFQYAKRPHGSEIVIIGTLASFGWAIGVALLTHVVLIELAGE